jgi:hypothetical protein
LPTSKVARAGGASRRPHLDSFHFAARGPRPKDLTFTERDGYFMRRIVSRFGLLAGRSLIPLAALAIILGTVLWGPWVSLLLAAGFWYVAGRLV